MGHGERMAGVRRGCGMHPGRGGPHVPRAAQSPAGPPSMLCWVRAPAVGPARRYWVTVMVPRKLGKRDGGWIEQW